MNQDIPTEPRPSHSMLCTKAWTAYVRTALIATVLVLGAMSMLGSKSKMGGFILLILTLAFATYRFMEIRSHRMYSNETGVWLSRGILPWTQGIVGVKWRDIDEATYIQNMLSWMSGSYTVRVGHRFTKSSELVLKHMSRGNDAVMTINSAHADLVRLNRLS